MLRWRLHADCQTQIMGDHGKVAHIDKYFNRGFRCSQQIGPFDRGRTRGVCKLRRGLGKVYEDT